MIELDAIGRDFAVGDTVVHALQGVALSIPDGDYCSIMGPSGSGKSTLLNILGCLDRPTAERTVSTARTWGSSTTKRCLGSAVTGSGSCSSSTTWSRG